jgi:hypothetical protein
VLLSTYLTCFEPDDDVVLYLLTKPFHSSSNFSGLLRGICVSAKLSSYVPLPNRIILDLECAFAEWAETTVGPNTEFGKLPTVYVLSSHISQSQLRDLYAAADAFVLPSR